MADNTDNEHLDNPASVQSENSSEETTPAKGAETIAQNQEAATMEVHHHPHVEKRKFKEYFFEFLMIFLAVSMGFIAENIREHVIEKETVKRNMEMLVIGLKNDTARINNVILFNKKRIRYLDTLLAFQATKHPDSLISNRFYYLFSVSERVSYFRYNDAAFEQMKSSGSIRLIKNKGILDSIYRYVQQNKSISTVENYAEQWYKAVNESSSKFMNFQKAFHFDDDSTLSAPDISYYGNDKTNTILQFFNDEAGLRNLLLNYYIPNLERQQKKAIALITFLKNEYHLENS